jgi:hypothetical protein
MTAFWLRRDFIQPDWGLAILPVAARVDPRYSTGGIVKGEGYASIH